MNELQSLIFYLVNFTLSALLIYLGSLTKYQNIALSIKKGVKINVFTTLGLLIPILIGGLLYGVGIDYSGYIRLYEKSNELSYEEFVDYNDFWTVEPTFYILARLSMTLVNSSWLLFTFYSFINITFFYLFVKTLIPKQRAVGFYIYLLLFFLFTLTLMRQGAAISICLYSLTFLLNKRYIPYLALVALASTFHFSALLFLISLPIYLLLRSPVPKWITIITVVGLGVLAVSSPLLIQILTSIPPFDKYIYLLNKSRDEVFIGWTFLLQLSIVVLISIFYYRISRRNTHSSLLFVLLLVGIISYSLNFYIDYASRMAYYFLPASSILLTYCINQFKDNKILTLITLAACVLYFIKIYFTGNTLMVFPYNFIWSAY